MPLETWVARFIVENGRVTEEGSRLRTFQRRRLDEPDVDLHVLGEPSGLKGDDLGAQALDAIGRLFLQDRLSLTGGLLRALRSTHETLLDWNRRSVPREQVSLGVSAAAVSGNVVYLAQSGPSLAFYRRDGSLDRLVPDAGDSHAPLGEGDVEPLTRRFELAPGDLLVVSSTSLETILDEETLDVMLERGSDEALPELYLLTRDLPVFALFAVTCYETPDEDGASPVAVEDEVQATPARELEPRLPIDFDAPLEPVAAEDQTTAPVLVAPPPLDISRPVVRLRNEQAPGRTSDYARTTGAGPRVRFGITQPRFVVLGAALALLLYLAISTIPDLLNQDAQQRLADRVEAATLQLAAAQVETDPGRRRALYEGTRLAATEAMRIDPLHTEAAELRQQAIAALAAMDAVLPLDPVTTVTTLSRQITGDVSLDSLAVAAGNAYLLDSRGDRIIAVPLAAAGAPVTVFQAGETYAGTPAREPLFVTWEGTAQTGRLLILDAERKLFELRPGSTPGPLPLRRPNIWASVGGITAYDGNLYVLDPQGHQVHRYLPSATGFDSEPSTVLSGQERITDAVSFAVDGDIYIVLGNGEVKRFSGGVETGFPLAGIDRTLQTPNDIVALTASQEVFIADTGNRRIVVAGRDGVFRRQLVSNSFTDIRALAIDPTGGQLYVIVGDALLTAPIVR
jgi:hypothetical protein